MAETAKKVEITKKSAPSAPLQLVPAREMIERIDKLYNQIARRAFEIFEGNGKLFGRELEDWFKAESELLHPVHVDVAETENEIDIRAEIPGFAANEVEVSVDGNCLTIAGRRETKQERKEKKTIYREQCSDQMMRVITLPAPVDAAKAEATLKDGMLELKLPKVAPAKKIPIAAKAS